MDHTEVRILRLGEAENDAAYWRTQPARQRVNTVEEIRREYHGWRGAYPPADLREFAELLSKHGVRHLIVGGYAVAFHGHPRYTKDLDVWVERDEGNVRRLLAALDEFGFGSAGLTPGDFLQPGRIVQLGKPPNRIDLLTDISGVDFQEAYARKVSDEMEGTSVYFIGLDDLRVNKRAVGRYQDLADLENLE